MTNTSMTDRFDFAFEALTGHTPFPWQRRLYEEYFSRGKLPPAVDIPTGLGKTAVMAVWLLARAAGASLPRRLVYVVDRRAVVDQATAFAEGLQKALQENERLESARRALDLDDRPLPISTLRGRHVDNREWMAHPAAPAIVVGTVDMVGSRLLFEGYGVSRRMRPYGAGLLGCDTLVMLDEAHLARPFERLLQTIEKGQRVPLGDPDDAGTGVFAGPAACNGLPPPLRTLSLSATLGVDADKKPLRLDNDDRTNDTVRGRLEARKSLTVENLDTGSNLPDVLAEKAWDTMQAASDAKPASVAVYCDRRTDAEKVAKLLEARARKETTEPVVILFVGGRRVHEREEAAAELREHGLIGDPPAAHSVPVFLVATSAGEVGVDLDADHAVCDLVAWERMVQRFGRVNRRGRGTARVRVIHHDQPGGSKAEEDIVSRHAAVRGLLDNLPVDHEGGRQAGPASLVALADDPALRARIAGATTPMPLYPALTRPLVDAWAMTSLEDHAGRPEVGPWLRGWEADDKPQTAVVWRQFLPLRFQAHSRAAEAHSEREVRAFFAAAPPQTVELLETETWRVVEWLRKRARKLLADLKASAPSDEPASFPGIDDADDGGETVARPGLLAPLSINCPIAFLLDGANRPVSQKVSWSLTDIDERSTKQLQASLADKRVVVDARVGGIETGVLKHDAATDGRASTIEDNWGKRDDDPDGSPWNFRVNALPEHDRRLFALEDSPSGAISAAHYWQDVHSTPYRVSAEGEALSRLIVQKRGSDCESENARSSARRAQRLNDHQQWAVEEAERIADSLGLGEPYKIMLTAAARHHDDGKSASRWQRAFDAPQEGGPYAKTTHSPNLHLLDGYRHELKSALDVARNGIEGIARTDPGFELALHLIAAHHGLARPSIGVDGFDDLPPSQAETGAHSIAVRFARLQRQWGPWGLAWWEVLLRAADQAASRRLDAEAK